MNVMQSRCSIGKHGMTGWNNVILFFFPIVFFMFFSTACSRQAEPIKIGAILSLSGPASYLQEFRDAMILAMDEINRAGGINGRKIELFIEDSRTTPEGGKAAFEKLQKEHQPLLYIVNHSSVAMAVRDMAEEAKVCLIVVPSAAAELTTNQKWTFRYWVTAQQEIPPIITILNTLKVTKLGIIYLDDPFGRSLLQFLESSFKGENHAILTAAFPAKATQFKDQIKTVLDTEAIYVGGYVSHVPMIMAEIRAAGYSGHLLAVSSASDAIARKNPAVEGIYLAAPLIYNQEYLYAKELSDKYTATYHIPLSFISATGYDILKLLEGLLAGKEINRESIRNVLDQGFHFPSSLGDKDVTVGSHEINFKLYPAQIRNGGIHFLNTRL